MNIHIKEEEVKLILEALKDASGTIWQNAKETSDVYRAKKYLQEYEMAFELLNYLEEELFRHQRGK
jgi:hypothetical protein